MIFKFDEKDEPLDEEQITSNSIFVGLGVKTPSKARK